jgi:hypothetical protein
MPSVSEDVPLTIVGSRYVDADRGPDAEKDCNSRRDDNVESSSAIGLRNPATRMNVRKSSVSVPGPAHSRFASLLERNFAEEESLENVCCLISKNVRGRRS